MIKMGPSNQNNSKKGIVNTFDSKNNCSLRTRIASKIMEENMSILEDDSLGKIRGRKVKKSKKIDCN